MIQKYFYNKNISFTVILLNRYKIFNITCRLLKFKKIKILMFLNINVNTVV